MIKRGIKGIFLIVFSMLLMTSTFSEFTAAIRMSMSETRLSIADANSYVVYFGAGGLSSNNLKLHCFDLLILDPDEWSEEHVSYWKENGKIVVAYLSIGTAENWRWYWPLVEEKWKITPVDEWPGEWYIDCRKVGWQELILSEVIPKILSKGFHGLFLDNIDVAELYPETASGVVGLVGEIRSRYPRIILIANNGLCVMSRIWEKLDGLVKEDVSSTYDWNIDDYVKVPLDESDAVLETLASWRKRGLKVFALDYAVTRSLAEYDYERARRYGLIPYAANIMLDEIYVWESNSSCHDDYVITSYWMVHEKFYSGEKVAVEDGDGGLLGYYRLDFTADVKVEGWGEGDGAGNDGEYLGYDPSIGFMKSKEPLDAYGQPLIPWLTIAADQSIPKGTEVTIKSLGPEADVASWVAEKLLTTTFVVSDRGPSVKGHHIDVYVGDQTQRNMNESPLALYVCGATVCVVSQEQPSPVQYVSGEVIVGFKGSAGYAQIARLIEGKRGKVIRQLNHLDAVVAKVDEETVEAFMEQMRESSLIRYVERNGRVMLTLTPNDPGWSQQWGPKKIQADTAWNTQTGDKSMLVAVVDTGVDWNHPDLAANYVALGYDWWNDDSDPMDDHGHGTHCAGIIAAVLNNGKGMAGLAQVRVMAEKFLSSDGWGTYADAASALIHAADAGADIISNSWGGYGDSDLVHEAVRYAYNKGALLVAAAGNDGWDWELYPAAYDEVVAVTATDQSDNPAWFTNFGSWVEVAAPGVSIYSTVWDDSYASWSGTSMATPHAAGVAALIWSQFPGMTRDQVRARLRNTADDLGDSGFDIYYGYGRLNARKAVGTSSPNAPSGLTATAVSSSQINLAWTDNSADESDFHIERKEGSGGTWTEIQTVGANTVSHQDNGLSPSTTYYYRVRAHRHSDNLYSGYSNEASATTSGGIFQYQAGKVNADHNWATASFPSSFSSTPVIVAAIMSENDGDNSHIDLRNPSASGFQARVEEDKSLDGRHATEVIGWFAMLPGTYTVDGKKVIAGTISADHQWKQVTFPSSFSSTPVIVATIMSENGGDNCHIDLRNPSATGFQVRVEEDTSCDGWHATETIGWIALDPGTYNINGAKLIADKVNADHNWAAASFPSSFSSTPTIVAQIMTENGGDNSHIDLRNPSASGFQARVEEDVGCDGWHTTETIGWIAIESGNGSPVDSLSVGLVSPNDGASLTSSPIEIRARVTFDGSAVQGATVSFYVDGTLKGPVSSDSNGYASYNFYPSSAKTYTWYATAEKSGYNPGTSPTWSFTYSPSGGDFQYQAGKINADHDWATVSFPSSFASTPVIVAAIMSENEGDNCHIDLKDPSSTGFKVRVEEDTSCDGKHATETIGWLAIKSGVYVVDGKKIIAGTAIADHQWKQVTFPSSFSSTPVIVATIITENGGDNCHVDIKSPSATGFWVRVEEDVGKDGWHTTETIAWIALDPGTYNINGAKLIADKVNANHNWATVNFPSSFSSTPAIMAQVMTENGGDNSHIDLRNPSASGFQARVEEDVSCDGPHATETIGWIAIESG